VPSAPVFGYPIGAQHEEQIEGKPFQMQAFERNRLELHPENQRPYDVLLGRLGPDRLSQQGRDWMTFPKSESQAGCRFFPQTGHNVCGEILQAWHANGLEFDGRCGAASDSGGGRLVGAASEVKPRRSLGGFWLSNVAQTAELEPTTCGLED
jgi:hypothetical protein